MRPEPRPKRSAIFVNYRRDDSAGHAGRLFDRLSGRFPDRVFMDIDKIEPGIDFVGVIEEAVGCCEVLIVVIGRAWLSATDAAGRRRLDNPSDFVRLEIAAALDRSIRIIPVLVEGAVMPAPEELPPELARLTRRNAIELSDARWTFDVDRLLQTIEGVLQDKAPSALLPVAPPSTRKRTPARWLALSVLVLLAVSGWTGWRLGMRPSLWTTEALTPIPQEHAKAVESLPQPQKPAQESPAQKLTQERPQERPPRKKTVRTPPKGAGKRRVDSVVRWAKGLLKGRSGNQ
jgi:hypothetical protein